MSNEPRDPAFNAEEHEILSTIVPEVESVDTPDPGQPDPAAAQTPEAAPAAATPEAAPAAGTPTQGTTPAATPAASAEPSATPAQTSEPDKPKGDTRAALRAARHSEKRLRDELAEKERELENLRQGKTLPQNDVSEEELQQLEQDFPAMAKVVRRNQELAREVQQLKAGAQTPAGSEFEPLEYAPAVQMIIDEVPDLLAWQHDPDAQDKFQRAIEYDKALFVDPDWKDKSAVERFAEAARRTKEATGQATPALTPAAAAAAKPTVDPAAAIAAAPASGPKGISDFRGGQPPTTPTLNYERMSDEAVMASLPVSD